MKLSRQDIQHIAELARLDLTEDELKTYGSQLSDILNYVEKLRQVDVTGTEPTAQITGLESILREDIIEDWDKQELEQALAQAPEREGRQVKVKRIL